MIVYSILQLRYDITLWRYNNYLVQTITMDIRFVFFNIIDGPNWLDLSPLLWQRQNAITISLPIAIENIMWASLYMYWIIWYTCFLQSLPTLMFNWQWQHFFYPYDHVRKDFTTNSIEHHAKMFSYAKNKHYIFIWWCFHFSLIECFDMMSYIRLF